VTRKCIFCGQSPVTNEHIFSRDWLETLMPATDRFVHRHLREERADDDSFDVLWRKDEFDVKVKCVCRDCNSGWMNDLDKEAEPFTTPMAMGLETTLPTLRTQTSVAAWATKLAMMCDHTQRVPVVESAAHKAFYETRTPVTGSTIWLARTRPEGFTAGARSVSWAMGEGRTTNAYFCTIDVNHLVLQVFIPRSDTPEGWGFDRSKNVAFVRQLWPPGFTKIVWPPPGIVPADKMENFARAFIRKS
jgi:hypothetical protein